MVATHDELMLLFAPAALGRLGFLAFSLMVFRVFIVSAALGGIGFFDFCSRVCRVSSKGTNLHYGLILGTLDVSANPKPK